MATKIGTIFAHAGPTGPTGPSGPSGAGGGGGGGLSIPTNPVWSAATAYVTGNIVNRTGWLFVALSDSTGIDPELDDGSHWNNFLIDTPPLPWNSGATYGLYNLVVHIGAIWAATGAAVTTEPGATNGEWYRVYRIVADDASLVFTGHGALPDPPPAAAVNGDLYYDLDAATFTPIVIASGGGDVG